MAKRAKKAAGKKVGKKVERIYLLRNGDGEIGVYRSTSPLTTVISTYVDGVKNAEGKEVSCAANLCSEAGKLVPIPPNVLVDVTDKLKEFSSLVPSTSVAG